MKKLVYLLVILGASFLTGCDPLEDINNEIDTQVLVSPPIVGDDIITLTSDDYAGLVEQGSDEDPDYYETFEAFSDVDDAKAMLPAFLSNKYPLWAQGSSVLVNYNLFDGNPEEVSSFVNADVYELESGDYPTADSNAFYLSENPEDSLPTILLNNISSPEVGDVVKVEYNHFTEEPVTGFAPVVEYTFADSFEGWTVQEESGLEDVWTTNSSYVQGNGFFGTQIANEEWLVSPSIDLTSESSVKFQITHALKYATDASLLKILVATDYTGDIATATWSEITLATAPGVDDLVPSEDYDFSAYDGETVNVALKYESTDSDAGRWRVESLSLKTVGIEGDTISKSVFYQFTESGDWEAVEDVISLTSEDYDLMGENSGQPGQYNNFSSSVLTSNYLPTFLNLTYPFAQEEDTIYVIYRYFTGSSLGTVDKGNLYTLVNGVWTASVTSLQFGFDGDVWVPDNTIKYTLVGADYDYISEQLIAEPGFEGPADSAGNYGNFDRRPDNSNYWSDEMLVTAFDILLDTIDANAEDEQKYLLTFDIYNGSNGTESFSLIKVNGEWVANTQ